MKTCIFRYPEYFTSLPEYSARRGKQIKIPRPLIKGKEYDDEGDPMFLIQSEDGWQGHAFESELEEIK